VFLHQYLIKQVRIQDNFRKNLILVSHDEQSQQISRKRKIESIDSANNYNKNTKFRNDNGELADIIYNMDMRLDDLTRTCNGLRSSIHTLTKMVTQLVNNQRQVNLSILKFFRIICIILI
jgi:hypothetical protein